MVTMSGMDGGLIARQLAAYKLKPGTWRDAQDSQR